MNNQPCKIILIFLFGTVLAACGGGGGGGDGDGDGDKGVTYTGKTTPAVIEDTNAKTLAEGVIGGSSTGTAFGVVSDEPGRQSNPTILDVARIFSGAVMQLDLSPASATLPAAIQSVKDKVACQDGGRISFDLRVNDVTLDFNGNFNFIHCAEDGKTINGETTVSGSLSTGVLDFNFKPSVTVTSGADSHTMSCTVGTSVSGSSATIVLNIRFRNNNTKMVEKTNNLTISMTDNISFLEMIITGRYYHPDYGYVDTVTDLPFQINVTDQWPYAGELTITGDNGSKAHLIVISNTQYTLEVDADGDGSYDGPATTEDFG